MRRVQVTLASLVPLVLSLLMVNVASAERPPGTFWVDRNDWGWAIQIKPTGPEQIEKIVKTITKACPVVTIARRDKGEVERWTEVSVSSGWISVGIDAPKECKTRILSALSKVDGLLRGDDHEDHTHFSALDVALADDGFVSGPSPTPTQPVKPRESLLEEYLKDHFYHLVAPDMRLLLVQLKDKERVDAIEALVRKEKPDAFVWTRSDDVEPIIKNRPTMVIDPPGPLGVWLVTIGPDLGLQAKVEKYLTGLAVPQRPDQTAPAP